MTLCCITTHTGIDMPSCAWMLYHNPWSLNQFAAIWCCYVVLQQLKRGAECCHLAKQCYITTPEARISLLPSGASMLYCNNWNVERSAAIWCQYIVLQPLKPVQVVTEIKRSNWDSISHNCVANNSNLLAYYACVDCSVHTHRSFDSSWCFIVQGLTV
jgi:hypothetical protein